MTKRNEVENQQNIFLKGSGAPTASVGVPGQMYLDTTNRNLYGPKDVNNSWGSAFSLGPIAGLSVFAGGVVTSSAMTSSTMTMAAGGTGVWNVSFNTAMPDANYEVLTSNGSATVLEAQITSKTTTGFTVTWKNTSGTATANTTWDVVALHA